MDGTGGGNTKRNKSSREKLVSYGFTHLWNIGNSRKFSRRRKGRMKVGQTEGGMNHEILWTLGNKLRASEGSGSGGLGYAGDGY